MPSFAHEYESKLFPDVFARCQHDRKSLPLIRLLLHRFYPFLIVELGTARGGFTSLLQDAVPYAEIHTFDIRDDLIEDWKKKKLFKNVHFYYEDIIGKSLCDQYEVEGRFDEWLAIPGCENLKIINLLKRPERKLLYCDNGHKKEEFKLYSKYLNKGDLIGVHDFDPRVKDGLVYDDIKEELGMFKDYGFNSLFEKCGFTSRFWIRK